MLLKPSKDPLKGIYILTTGTHDYVILYSNTNLADGIKEINFFKKSIMLVIWINKIKFCELMIYKNVLKGNQKHRRRCYKDRARVKILHQAESSLISKI